MRAAARMVFNFILSPDGRDWIDEAGEGYRWPAGWATVAFNS